MTIKPPRVFIIHSDADSFIARIVADRLEALGIDVWGDVKIQPGDDWRDATINAIKQSDAFVVVLTPDSLLSPKFMMELGAASTIGNRIIPVFTGMTVEQIYEKGPFLLNGIDLIPLEDFYSQAEDFVPAGNS